MASRVPTGGASGSTEADRSTKRRALRRARLLRLRQLQDNPGVTSDLVNSEISRARFHFSDSLANRRPDKSVEREADGEIRFVSPKIAMSDTGYPPKGRPKVTVVSFNVTHNHLARAYILADLLRSHYPVELIGPVFSEYGNEVWKPLQQSRVPIKWFYGMNLPTYFEQLKKVATKIDGDIIIVSKPMLPSYLLGIILKNLRNRPLILDIDDFEFGAFIGTSRDGADNDAPLRLDLMSGVSRDEDFYKPYGRLWTRYCDSIVGHADAITVANVALQTRYGGALIPQIRDERDFDPGLFDRDAIRAEFGYEKDDRVILFLGTPYWHKGVHRVAEALQELGNDKYKLCVIGSILDDELRAYFSDLGNRNFQFLPDQSFHDTPKNLCLADLVCLLQDPAHSTASHQMPAKFVDALAMGVPMLGTRTLPLMDAARNGLIEVLDDEPLHEKINEIFGNYARHKERALRNRANYREQYSYAANRSKLVDVIEGLSDAPPAVPGEFSRLITAFHDEQRKMSTVADSVI
jgi:glycosyltransferase involved in cell wall biosynthesis